MAAVASRRRLGGAPRPSRAMARAPRCRRCRRSRRTRCAGPAGRRGSRRCRRPRLPLSSSLAKRLMKSLSAPSTVRQTLVFERLAGSCARWPSQLRPSTIRSSAAALASVRAIMPLRPPMPFAHSSATIASSTASIEGVLIVSPLKTALDQLARFGEAEDLGQRPVGGVAFQPLDRARAEDQDAVRRPRRRAPSAS